MKLGQVGPFHKEFHESLRTNPHAILNAIGLALCLVHSHQTPTAGPAGDSESTFFIQPRVCNVTPSIPLINLKASSLGKFICVRGNVVHVSAVRPLVIDAEFICPKCEAPIKQIFPDGKYKQPVRCSTHSCRSRHFLL